MGRVMRWISVESSGSQVLHEIGRVKLIGHQYRITALTSETRQRQHLANTG